jgi:hypothetical protein
MPISLIPLLPILPILFDRPIATPPEPPPSVATSRVKDSEIYVPVGLALYSSPNRLAVGLGGGLGYRYLINSTWSLYSEARIGWYTGLVGLFATGATVGFSVHKWNPQLGLGGLLFFGDSIRVLGSSDPQVPGKVAVAVSARISPLRFVHERFYGSALSVDVGCGISRGGCGLALAVSILETGVRF